MSVTTNLADDLEPGRMKPREARATAGKGLNPVGLDDMGDCLHPNFPADSSNASRWPAR